MDEQQLLAELRGARERVDRAAECKALGDLGVAYYQGQRWQEALGTLTEYLNVAIELGDRWSEAVALYYLGLTQRAIEEPWLAVKSFALAYRWFRGLGQEQFSATVWKELGQQGQRYLDEKNFVDALQVYCLQIDILLVHFADHKAANWVSINVGRTYYSEGSFQEAIACYDGVLGMAQVLKDQALESLALAWLGCCYRELGELETGVSYFERRLTLVRELGDHAAQQETEEWLMRISSQLKQPDHTVGYEEVQVGESLGMRSSENIAQEYFDFLIQVLLAVSDNAANPQVVYPLLAENIDKLDDNFRQALESWGTETLRTVELDEAN